MSPVTPADLEWDLADRLRKSLRAARLSVRDMAEYQGVRREAVSTWLTGRIAPNTRTLRLWAMRCGVSYEWLVTGVEPPKEEQLGVDNSNHSYQRRGLSRNRAVHLRKCFS